ncbi:MAG: sigma-70 family RNA polymerase sigma factor [Proteobacteria bacterium]|nr:sigma-70 family RNA polymerase sigma factor [Pseudomonadota bacterium]
MDPIKLFEDNLPLIDEVIGIIGFKRNLDKTEAADFRSDVHLKLIDNDYKAIRDFKGEASFRTYLFCKIQSIFIDKLRAEKGRWRSSEPAKKMGKMAELLEKLLYNEHHSFEAAYEIICIRHQNLGVELPDREDLEKMATGLKTKMGRPRISSFEGQLDNVQSSMEPADEAMEIQDLKPKKKRIDALTKSVEQTLTAEDKLILKMHFKDKHSISTISRIMKKKRHQVDRRLKEILLEFKKKIIAEGIDKNEVMDVIQYGGKLE